MFLLTRKPSMSVSELFHDSLASLLFTSNPALTLVGATGGAKTEGTDDLASVKETIRE